MATLRLRTALAAVSLAALAFAVPAQAAFPGTNGKIAFTAASNIQAVNPDGSGLTNLTAGQGENFHPAWSADGRKLAFSSRRDGNFEIYVMNADGSDQVRLTSDPATDAEPSWSPDGRIVFESNRDGSYELYVMNADGSNQVRLTNTPQNEASPAWSPDGQKIAFQDSGSGGIVVMNADGSGRTQLGTIGTFMPNWSPDGREIWSWWEYYDPIAEETFSDLASYDLQTGTDRQGFFIDTWASMPAVSPDNREVVHTLNGELWVMARTGAGRRVAPIGDDPDWQPIPASAPGPYAKPRGATPMYISLVPAYRACTAPNNQHGASLAYPSCSPPVLAGSNLTIGIGDGTPPPAKSIGSLSLKVIVGPAGPPDDADVRIGFSMTNVIERSNGADYTGELGMRTKVRLTDTQQGVGSTTDFTYSFSIPCAATADTTVGALCSLTTTADGLVPNTIVESQRSIWGLDQVRIYDGGADGDADTTNDNQLFAVQGVFVP